MEDLEARMTAVLEALKKATDEVKEIQKEMKKIAKEAAKAKPAADKPKKKVKEEAAADSDDTPAAAGGGPPEKAKVEKKPKAKKAEKADSDAPAAGGKPAEKRLIRMSGPTLKAFEKALGDKSADHKKEFMSYVNEMDADKYASMALEKHMESYARVLSPTVLTIIQLRAQKHDLNEITPLVFYNSKTDSFVTGPADKDGEEFDDATVDGVDYVVGVDTKRVHLEGVGDDADGPCVGWFGVGKFLLADQ
jgi:hypothetical protein